MKKILEFLGNSVSAILKGEFLLRMHFQDYFVHIIYTFFLLWMTIFLSIKVENTMVKVENNKDRLTDMKIYHAQKTVQMVSLNRISTVEKLLQREGSEVAFPEEPAKRIRKK